MRSQRHANADLLCALIDEITDHAVQTDDRQHQSERCEYAHQRQQKLLVCYAAIHQELNRANFPHRLIGIDFPERPVALVRQTQRLDRRSE